jgi:hypothetical protein
MQTKRSSHFSLHDRENTQIMNKDQASEYQPRENKRKQTSTGPGKASATLHGARLWPLCCVQRIHLPVSIMDMRARQRVYIADLESIFHSILKLSCLMIFLIQVESLVFLKKIKISHILL